MESISKLTISRDLQLMRCDISALQKMAENIQKRVDRLPDEPLKHEWKVGEWAYDNTQKATFVIAFVSRSADPQDSGLREDLGGSEIKWHLRTNCTPIPTPHEIGTWIHYGDVSFKIEKREWLTALNDWFYQDDTHSLCGKTATVIPPPKFEIGWTVRCVVSIYTIGYRIWKDTDWRYWGDKESFAGGDKESSLTRVPDVPVHEWKVGEWFFDKERNGIFQISELVSGELESRAAVSSRRHNIEHCIPVHFIQTAESTIGEGSIVRTPDGWVGSVAMQRNNGRWYVYGHGINAHRGWYHPAELTLCPPEGK